MISDIMFPSRIAFLDLFGIFNISWINPYIGLRWFMIVLLNERELVILITGTSVGTDQKFA